MTGTPSATALSSAPTRADANLRTAKLRGSVGVVWEDGNICTADSIEMPFWCVCVCFGIGTLFGRGQKANPPFAHIF